MPYKINPFTGNPDYYDASTGGTVTSVASGIGLTGGPITTTGTLDIDITKVPYYAGGPGSAGFVKWNGTAWAIDTTSYVNKAGDTMTGSLILNADPTTALGAATKQYVDNIATGINFHAPVVAATTAPLPAVTYSNGVGGVGATLIATSPGALTIDTVTFLGGGTERVLIKNQVSGLENGIYVVNVAGDGVTPFQLTRATDADNSPAGELAFGDFCFVEQGPTNGGFGYILNTTGTITVGVTALSYVIFNAAQVVTAGTGLTEFPTNTLSIDTTKVPYYSGGFSAGFAKWNGSSWVFDNSTYLDTTTAASTYLTIANAITTYYPLSSNPSGYLTSASLSGYVPYTGATGNVSLGAFQLTTSQVNISTAGTLTTTAGVLKLEAAAATNLILNTPNVTTGASTKIQFGGSDLIELKGLASTATVTNFRYTNPNNINQQGPISSMIIDPGTRTWDYTNVPNGPTDVQKEIEILSPNYTDNNPGPAVSWDGLAVTLYVNPPVTNTTGVGYGLGIKGHFLIDGDASEYPGGTYMNIGNGDGTMIGFNGAKLSFFGNPPISKPAAVTTVQGLSTALSNLGLISVSTLSFGTTGSVLFAGASGALSQDNANFFWDDTNNRLGIGNNTPTEALTVTGNMLLNLTGSTSVKIYNVTGINTYESAGPTLISSTGGNYVNIRASGDFGIQTNGSNLNKLVISTSNNLGNTTTQFNSTLFAQGNVLASTEVRSVLFSGNTKTWQTGNITTQRWFHITANTAAFAGASVITNNYSLYVDATTVGSNATITNNYAAGFEGNVIIRDSLPISTLLNADLEVHKYANRDIVAVVRNDWQGVSNIASASVIARSDSSTQLKMSMTSNNYATVGLIIAGTGQLTTGGSLANRLLIGHSTSSKDIIFVNGGTAAANEIFRISSTNTIDIYDARNLTFGTTTGTKIGTATTQRLGFFNATPVPQQGAVTTAQGIADALTTLGFLAAGSVVPSGGSSTPNVQSVVSAATVTPTFVNDEVIITAQAVNLTLANPTGTAAEGKSLIIRIKDNGTTRGITFDTQYRAINVVLPTSTTANRTLYLSMIYNATDTRWDVTGVGLENANPDNTVQLLYYSNNC